MRISTMASQQEAQEVHYSGSKSMPFIIGNETCERLGSAGTTTNLLVYLTTVFNMKAINATTLVNTFNGTSNLAALPGAILCDAYFGRYKTLGFASVASFMGMLVLTLTAAISELHPPRCAEKEESDACPEPTTWQMAILLGGLGLMVVGAGGIRPCNMAFGADQFNPNTESGKKGIKRFLNWYYFSLAFAMMVSLSLIAYVQAEKSWAWGLAIPTLLMLFSCALFFTGSRVYVRVKPEGSPLASTARVLVAAVKKRHMKSPEQPWLSLFNHMPNTSINSKLPYTNQFRYLDKAAIIDLDHDTISPDGSSLNPWRLCTMQQVEEAKCLVRVAPIWASAIMYYISIVQQHTFAIFQALQSDRRLGDTGFRIPATSYSLFVMLGVAIWIPLYNRVIAPALRRFAGKEARPPTLLQRMSSGMVLSIAAMVISGLVEEKRRASALIGPIGTEPKRGAISPISGFWLVPQLTLMGFSEALTIISLIEFYYSQLPEGMRSVSGSFLYIGFAVSNYLSNLLISVVKHMTKARPHKGNQWLTEDLNEGKLDWFYYLIAALEVINLGFFMVCAKWYKYKGNTSKDTGEVLSK